ncbi:MAG: hypothetical protein IJG81_02010 [Muribaculaceae bacterium]|nr:hypothetical protein [Muribaculaceae bacterium]
MTRTTQILFKLLMMLAIAGITLNSCEKQRLPGDGDWYPMEWNDVSGLSMVDNAYQVPASGGSYKFHCKNYSAFWISSIEEDGELFMPNIDNNDWKDLSGQWTHVQCLADGDLVVTFEPLSFYSSASKRTMNLCVTAGVFYSFRFVQNNNAN